LVIVRNESHFPPSFADCFDVCNVAYSSNLCISLKIFGHGLLLTVR
jgi:hypothetical protein